MYIDLTLCSDVQYIDVDIYAYLCAYYCNRVIYLTFCILLSLIHINVLKVGHNM